MQYSAFFKEEARQETRGMAMSVGDRGREADLDNALSQSWHFGLSNEKARAIIDKFVRHVNKWPQHFEKCGFTEKEIDILQPSFKAAGAQGW